MKPSDDLFRLIKRMNRSEKRSFRLFTKKYRDGEKKYLLLFDAIQQQEEYDEEKAKEDVAGEIKSDNFSSAKNYLWNLLNDFLIVAGPVTYQADRCRRHLDRAHLLHKMGIVQAARKEVRIAEKVAQKYEMVDFQLRINQLKRNITKRYQRKKMGPVMDQLLEEYTHLRQLREDQEEQAAIYDRLAVAMRSNLNRAGVRVEAPIRDILQHPALADDHSPQGFGARRMYHQSRCFVFLLQNASARELQEYLRLQEFWEAHPHQIKELYVEYRLFVANFLHSAAQNGRFDLFGDLLTQLKRLPIENEEDEIEAFSVGLFYEHLLAMNQRQLPQALEIARNIPAKLEKYGPQLADSTRLGFQTNLLLMYLVAGNFSQAHHWAVILRNSPLTQHRIDLQGLSRIFEVISGYELVKDGQYEHLVSRIRAGMEWLRNRKLAREFERTTLNALHRLIQKNSPEDKRTVLDQLQSELEAIPASAAPPGAEEVLLWVRSKLLGIDIRTVFAGNDGAGQSE